MSENVRSGRTVTDLFGDLSRQVSALFRNEVRLARAELSERMGAAGGAVAMLAAGAVLAVAALIVLLFALVTWLVEAFEVSPALAALIVGVVVALVAYGLVRVGLSRLKARNLAPRRTVEQLSRDAAVAKESFR